MNDNVAKIFMSEKSNIDKKIAELEKKLREIRALKNKNVRKERNGQLISMGVLLEEKYKASTPDEKAMIEAWSKEFLTGRNLERVSDCFKRIFLT